MKTTYTALAFVLTAIAPEVWAQPHPAPSKLSWDWFDALYEISYDSPYWEESREKSSWAGRVSTNIELAPNLHLSGSYDKERFDADVGGIHTRETLFIGRYGLGTHANFGHSSAFVLEAAREEVGESSHSDDAGSDPKDGYIVLRGFAYYAGLRHLLGSSELDIGYELSTVKDAIAIAASPDPVRIKIKLNTISVQLAAPLTRRLSATMRFEQLSSKGKVEQEALGVNDESSGHFENVLFGLRFAL